MLTFKIKPLFDDNNLLAPYWDKLNIVFAYINKEIGAYIGGLDASILLGVSPIDTPAAAAGSPDLRLVPNRETNILYQATKGIDANGDFVDGYVAFGKYMFDLLAVWDGTIPTLSVDPMTQKLTVSNAVGSRILNGFLHETLHAMGFVSLIDFTTLKQYDGANRLYDAYLKIEPNGDANFTGPNSQAIFGAKVPMLPYSMGQGSAFNHFVTDSKLGLSMDIMNPNINPLVINLSDLDFAVLKDMGYIVNKTLVSFDGHTFIPKPGATTITGTATADNLFLNGKRSDFTIKLVEGSYVVTDKNTPTNTDTLKSIENVKFNDVQVDLTVSQKAKTIDPKTLDSLVELYVAYFNRVPDGPGMSYWIEQIKAGRSLLDISKNFYEAALIFSELTGYTKDMSNTDFVKVIYKNVLARFGDTAPPDEDVNYWANNLATGANTKGTLISTMLFSAHTFKGDKSFGWVADLLDNKIAVGKVFSIEQGLSYFTDTETYTKAQAVALAVTPTDTQAALKLIGIPLTDVLS